MSPTARDRRARDELERKCHDWRDERDAEDDELPEREDDPPPTGTFH